MRNADALQLAKLALQEVRLLLKQNRLEAAGEIAELGNVLPVDEDNIVLEGLSYQKLFDYVTKYPERQRLTHFHSAMAALERPNPHKLPKLAESA